MRREIDSTAKYTYPWCVLYSKPDAGSAPIGSRIVGALSSDEMHVTLDGIQSAGFL